MACALPQTSTVSDLLPDLLLPRGLRRSGHGHIGLAREIAIGLLELRDTAASDLELVTVRAADQPALLQKPQRELQMFHRAPQHLRKLPSLHRRVGGSVSRLP